MTSLRVIQGSPFRAAIAPYYAILVKDTGATVNSGYRGVDAARILHKRGKHTQAELYATLPPGVANPPGFSSHEGFSDGNPIFHTPRGRRLAWWQDGIDVNDSDVPHMIHAARLRGWTLVQPYTSGAEVHHLNFARKPRPQGPRTMAKLIHLRATLPRS
jgi:hypothetical protein